MPRSAHRHNTSLLLVNPHRPPGRVPYGHDRHCPSLVRAWNFSAPYSALSTATLPVPAHVEHVYFLTTGQTQHTCRISHVDLALGYARDLQRPDPQHRTFSACLDARPCLQLVLHLRYLTCLTLHTKTRPSLPTAFLRCNTVSSQPALPTETSRCNVTNLRHSTGALAVQINTYVAIALRCHIAGLLRGNSRSD